jgi:toxin ParE1/3/4
MRVVIADEAFEDIRQIGDFIALDNPERAASFVIELVEACQGLAAMPNRYPLLLRFEASGVRRRQYGAYGIFYGVADDAVTVIHVLNNAMDYEAILFPDA